ncbi:MAG: hypothetical protein ABSE86_24435 [Bryobacteraceae bacterium]|jgi:hypothetical protein
MSPLDQLNTYLQRLESRLRLSALSKGTSLVTVSALVITVLLVWIINRYAFSPTSLLWARILLFISVATAIAFGLVIPLLRMNRRNAARSAECEFPDFQERLLTLAEKPNASNPFVELLAGDAMKVAAANQPERLAPTGPILGFLTSAGVAVAVLLWLILAGPGYLGYGTSLLWAGAPRSGNHAFYDIAVNPGDRTVRRKSDQLVTAQLLGFEAPKVRLFAQSKSASKWEPVEMRPSPGASTYEFLFSGLAENVEYYVEAGAVQSKHYNLKVIDLPSIQKIRVTYHYPAWSGMKDVVEDPGGDVRAVEGTDAEIAVLTDRPLNKGILMLSDDSQIPLQSGTGNWLTAHLPVQKDGMYHIAAIEQGENVRMSEDFFIEARKDSPPSVKITRPGRDAKVNPIEEVTVEVSAEDDFGLNEVSVHYSVNGGAEKTVSMLGQKGTKNADGKYVIALEDYKLSPGDIVSIYASARDARTTTKTDMYFIQAEPFERNYSQSQAQGGAGGGDNPAQEISEHQKEIIAATWNEAKNGPKDPSAAADDAKFLGQIQEKLAAQAKSLVDRAKARQLDGSPEMQNFVKNMEDAVGNMTESAKKIRAQKWNEALVPEQQGLQHALRAEDTFRDIQVAFGSAGGAGQGGNQARDLSNLADLELDREKNQYETGQQSASDSRAKEIDAAMQKLAELARRQQELAAKKDQQQPFRQRWEQEMLRREAEKLQRQMEQLTRGDSSQQSPSNQPGQQGQQGQTGQQGQQSQQSANSQQQRTGSTADPRLQQALDRLARATDDMRQAENQQGGNSDQASAGQKRAGERLQEAHDILNGIQRQNASQQLDDMAQKANQLSQHQTDFQNRLRQMFSGGTQPGQSQQQNSQLAGEKEQMANQLKDLQKQMGDTAQSLAGAKNPISSKLRDALSEAQQNEIELRMRKAAEWIRQGQGRETWLREPTVTMGLDRLRDQLQQVQAGLQQQGEPGKGAGDKGDIEKALAQLENMRNRMQQLTEGQGQRGNESRNGTRPQPGQDQSRQGQRPGQSQPGQSQSGQSQQGQGQQSGQGQPGQGQEGQGQQGQGQQGQAQNGSEPGAGQASPGQPGASPYGGVGNRGGSGEVYPHNGLEQGYRESLRDMSQLRDFIRTHPEYSNEVLQLLHAMSPAYANDAELSQRIGREVIPQMERLELELRRQLDDKNSDQVRSAGSEHVPAGYSDAIAEYFRKLSKGK